MVSLSHIYPNIARQTLPCTNITLISRQNFYHTALALKSTNSVINPCDCTVDKPKLVLLSNSPMPTPKLKLTQLFFLCFPKPSKYLPKPT